MTWEYMNDLNYRYEVVAGMPVDGSAVVDLCSGNTGFYELVKDRVKSYRACDLRKLHPIVEQMSDDKFVRSLKECDVLCVFGHGGHEITGEELESKTLTDSILYVIDKFDPFLVILESVKKFEPILKSITENYDYDVSILYTAGDTWLTNRVMYILGKDLVIS